MCKRALLFVILLSILLIGCKNKSLKNRIYDVVKYKCLKSDSCIVDIRDVANFQWDKFYLFPTGVSLNDMDTALGFDYPYFIDTDERIVFVSNNKIVYHEDNYLYSDYKAHGGIYFNLSIKWGVICYSSDSTHAIFNVKKTLSNGETYYELTPMFTQNVFTMHR